MALGKTHSSAMDNVGSSCFVLFCNKEQRVAGHIKCEEVDHRTLFMDSHWSILKLIVFEYLRLEINMPDDGRVVTAKLPDDLVSKMDEVADRIDRSKSWIVRQAVAEWLAEEQRRYELTLEAIESMDAGQSLSQEDVENHFAERRQARSKAKRAA